MTERIKQKRAAVPDTDAPRWSWSPPVNAVAPTLAEVLTILRETFPENTAESWDRVGLVCGDPQDTVSKILYALDPVNDIIDEAISGDYDLLVVHHPLFLKPIHGVPASDYKGAVVHRLIKAGCALYVAHTNADSANPGVSDALAHVLGVENLSPLLPRHDTSLNKVVTFVPGQDQEKVIDALAAAGAGRLGDYERCAWTASGQGTFRPLPGADPTIGTVGDIAEVGESRIEMVCQPRDTAAVVRALRSAHPYEEPAFDVFSQTPQPSGLGLGRVGELPQPLTLERFAEVAAKALPHTVQGIRVSGPADAIVQRVAVCGGSGDSLIDAARNSGADVYLTGDLRHHPASEAREASGGKVPYLVDVAHWASEWPWLHRCAATVIGALHARGQDVDYWVSTTPTDPWSFRVASSGGLVR